MKKNITIDSNNMLQDHRSILRHFTDKKKIILLVSLIILLGSVGILSSNNFTNNTSALSYQSAEQVNFTINPTVNVSISGNLTISNLSPGSTSDSNTITVTASSNAIAGYSLSSTVGDSNNASTELRKGNTNTTYKFSSITTNKPTLSDFDHNNNTWGYSYSTDSGSTWISGDITITDPTSPLYPTTGYNGLPLYTTDTPITLINAVSEGTNTISFKIAASSTNNQVAGEYNNIINFIALANENPSIIYMQDATLADCGKDMVDIRDNNVYSTALVGDRCWMTKNLDLPGGTKLTSADTDMSAEYEQQGLPTDNGFLADNKLPMSSQAGFDDNAKAFVYNSNNPTNNCSDPGCYSYYSWTAATLGSGLNISTDNADAPYSICPKGWHLPNTRAGIDSSSDFRALIIALGGSANISVYSPNTIPTAETINYNLSHTPINFPHAGLYYYSSPSYGGDGGYYWSSTSFPNLQIYSLAFHARYVSPVSNFDRGYGLPVRCLLSS